MANEKARYSDEDLAEFRAIIEEKIKGGKADLQRLYGSA